MSALRFTDPSWVGQADLRKGLMAAWKFEEASGTRYDSIGSANLTESGGTISSATGKSGNAAEFNRTDSRVLTVADQTSVQSGSAMTIALWIKFKSVPTVSWILSKGSGSNWSDYEYSLTTAGSGSNALAGWQFGTTSPSYQSLSLNNWHFCVAWFTGSQRGFWWNGNNGPQTGPATSATPNSHSLIVGGYSGATDYADVVIDELLFWNRALTRQEAQTLYRSGTGRFLDVNF